MRKILIIILISLSIIGVSLASEIQKYKINFDLDNILLKGRNIKENTEFISKNNIDFNFAKYNEKNSFLEITLRTLKNDKQYFSFKNKIDLISKKQISYMDNLKEKNLTSIYSFLDIKKERYFYYRTFENEKFDKERCLIFVTGTKKNINNLYNQIVNGVGCSTEIRLNHKNIKKILRSIKILEKN